MLDTTALYRKWKNDSETLMWSAIDSVVANGELLSTVSYSKPVDDCEKLWHLDVYECEGKIYKIIYTDYMYVDLELLGTSELEEEEIEE